MNLSDVRIFETLNPQEKDFLANVQKPFSDDFIDHVVKVSYFECARVCRSTCLSVLLTLPFPMHTFHDILVRVIL